MIGRDQDDAFATMLSTNDKTSFAVFAAFKALPEIASEVMKQCSGLVQESLICYQTCPWRNVLRDSPEVNSEEHISSKRIQKTVGSLPSETAITSFKATTKVD